MGSRMVFQKGNFKYSVLTEARLTIPQKVNIETDYKAMHQQLPIITIEHNFFLFPFHFIWSLNNNNKKIDVLTRFLIFNQLRKRKSNFLWIRFSRIAISSFHFCFNTIHNTKDFMFAFNFDTNQFFYMTFIATRL